ncbi:MAG: glycoside hydrolase family 3 C-terminal domain-containing protein [Prevotellaceae bacterium]|nr:glycoside hydrolase family 3 C-terminal domain-containing protein [Prevotellaceae bacterium]
MGAATSGFAADPQLGVASIDDVIKAMTVEEKVDLLVGAERRVGEGFSAEVGKSMSLVPGAAGTTQPIPRLGIPPVVLADGPAGLRISPIREGTDETFYCTAFPVATLLASSWNTELIENIGKAIGAEVLDYGVDVLLAPALNLHRNPLCGRNFEYYSEDPLLVGKITAAMVRGVQSKGVGTSIKHFAANSQETSRGANDVRITQRALRELYLKGFEIAVRESQPWTVMTSYNKINGVYTSESRELLTDILRDEWGFAGTVMTDWNGGVDPPLQIHAGNDLLMPGALAQRDAILEAVRIGQLSEKDVDTDVRRILELVLKSPRFRGYKFSNRPDLKAHAELTRASATEGMVLLKNSGNVLPLTNKNIAVFGITSYDFIAGGTGSGDVNEAYTISLGEGLTGAGFVNNRGVQELYDSHIAAENERNKPDPNNPWARFFRIRPSEFLPEPAVLEKAAAEASVALLTIGRNSGEFADRKLPNDFELSEVEQQLIANICKAFHAAGKKVVVILNIGGVIETASWKEQPDAILLAWQPGQEGGNSVADILSGKASPSGKLPMTFPISYMDIPSSSNFPFDAPPPGPTSFMSVKPASGEEKEPVRNVDYTLYEEDVYVGYRYFDAFGKATSYPFGYGLSYATFEYAQPKVQQSGNDYLVSLTVKNTGKTAAKEVVQLYVSAPNARLSKELKAFAKTKALQPGESENIALKVSVADLASFDEAASAWVAVAGEYKLLLGASSTDIKNTLRINVAQQLQTKVHNVLKPHTEIKILKK